MLSARDAQPLLLASIHKQEGGQVERLPERMRGDKESCVRGINSTLQNLPQWMTELQHGRTAVNTTEQTITII